MSYPGRWDLGSIYPDGIDDDITRLKAIGTELKEMALADAPLSTLIGKKDEGDRIAISITAYADAALSVDSSDPGLMKAAECAERAAAEYAEAGDAFTRAVGRSGEEAPAGYGYYVAAVRRDAGHLMSPEEEALAGQLALSGSSAWERLQEALSSTASDSGKTLTQLRADASSSSRSLRKESFGREISLLGTYGVPFASALSGVKGTVLLLDRKRGWQDPLERSLAESRFDSAALSAMMDAIRDSLPMFREYFRIKARHLGISDFSFFDLFAPAGQERRYSFEEAAASVFRSYGAFSDEMEAFAREAVDRRWIDSDMRPGKAGGAYDVYFPNAGESRVFLNFDSTYDSVLTLAHELGHAYHDRVLSPLPPSLAAYPMTLAETASVFAEKLVFADILASCRTGDEEVFVLDAFLTAASQVIVDIYSRFIFESRVFTEREEGPLPPERLSALMENAQREAYGDALAAFHPYMWAVKSHYYSADFSFYNYPYAFGEFFSLALFSRKDEPGFADVYRRMLSMTGSADACDVAASVGFDIHSDSFFRIGIDFIAKMIERYASWL